MQDVWDDVRGHEGTREDFLGKLIFELGSEEQSGSGRVGAQRRLSQLFKGKG